MCLVHSGHQMAFIHINVGRDGTWTRFHSSHCHSILPAYTASAYSVETIPKIVWKSINLSINGTGLKPQCATAFKFLQLTQKRKTVFLLEKINWSGPLWCDRFSKFLFMHCCGLGAMNFANFGLCLVRTQVYCWQSGIYNNIVLYYTHPSQAVFPRVRDWFHYLNVVLSQFWVNFQGISHLVTV